jgi:UDP-N-acetylmuramoyl-tripeptide--D-alanyl-D-alanine ligase
VRFRLDEVARAVEGTPQGPPDLVFEGVSTDSRTLTPGALFVALAGPRHDGHDHLAEAVARGAAGVVLHRGEAPAGTAAVRVDDTLLALGRLGRHVRRRLGLNVLAVTGSVGKTTTKELAAALLKGAGLRTLQTPGNWNNRVGLPLTLLSARGDEEAAVLELGISEPGEMAHLAAICEPDAAIVTAVAECHAEGLGSLEDIAREKLAIAGGLRPGGTLVLPHGDPLLVPPPLPGLRTLTFGWDEGAGVRGTQPCLLPPAGTRFRVEGREFRLHLPGRHNAANALAALAGARALGVDWSGAPEALAAVRPTPLRGEVRETPGGVHLLVDCYNANPRAVEAALATLGELAGSSRKLAVLGEMRELGPLAREGHARAGRAAAALPVAELHLLGQATVWTRDAAAAAGLPPERIWLYDDRDAVAASLSRRLRPGDWVLVKGSRALGLEAVADALTGWEGRP